MALASPPSYHIDNSARGDDHIPFLPDVYYCVVYEQVVLGEISQFYLQGKHLVFL